MAETLRAELKANCLCLVYMLDLSAYNEKDIPQVLESRKTRFESYRIVILISELEERYFGILIAIKSKVKKL